MTVSPGWNDLMMQFAFAFWGLGLLVAVGYFVLLAVRGDNKYKYDFINRYEIKTLWVAVILLITGGACFFNANVKGDWITIFWLFVRIFSTVAVAILIALIMQNLLKFYYPFFIEKRLKVLRYKPRISPKTGKPMKLLSEEEEDAYMDEGMIAEENVFSVDYDVWKDEETGYIKIEKYAGHLHALQCPECNYQTFKVVREEILRQPAPTEDGEVLKHYECGYCGYKAKKSVHLRYTSKMEATAAAT
ncbi:MAG: hypothetical protein MUC38_05300 [Cyclobacteriaceae bacterium]|jgi:hypothetical protein|nr:hypothetical protein [Cyclobacteriaceae bacterium]